MENTQTKIDLLLKKAVSSIKEVCSSDKLSDNSKIIAIKYLIEIQLDHHEGAIMEEMKGVITSW